MREVRGVRGVLRVLVLSHTTGYQLRAFNEAAEQLGIELVFATDRCHRLDDPWQDRAVAVRFHDLDASLAAIVARAAREPIQGVIAVGDRPVVLAARAAEALGIPWHSVEGALASTDKRRSRTVIAIARMPSPRFSAISLSSASPIAHRTSTIGYPCVLKPVGLSGSRGVIRVDDETEFGAAVQRIAALLSRPQIRTARAGLEDEILVEEYIDGQEFALEGVLTAGVLQVFALFDKPDPLEGPFFEETIYVTPSRAPIDLQTRISDRVQRAAAVLGLRHGPVHAECRVTPTGEIFVLEVAARPIGGLCSRVLRLTHPAHPAHPEHLETVLLRHAIGERVSDLAREPDAAAVMMVPIPERGVLKAVTGEESARNVDGVTEIRITAKVGQLLEPLPEAGSYLGFVFARGNTPADAEQAVREAHRRLQFDITREIAVNS